MALGNVVRNRLFAPTFGNFAVRTGHCDEPLSVGSSSVVAVSHGTSSSALASGDAGPSMEQIGGSSEGIPLLDGIFLSTSTSPKSLIDSTFEKRMIGRKGVR